MQPTESHGYTIAPLHPEHKCVCAYVSQGETSDSGERLRWVGSLIYIAYSPNIAITHKLLPPAETNARCSWNLECRIKS